MNVLAWARPLSLSRARPHTSESTRRGPPTSWRPAVIDDRLPGVQRPPAAGRPLPPVPGNDPDTGRAQRQHGLVAPPRM